MRISVLTPCFNAAPYLGEALESVFAQDWPLHEVLVVDDGSTDESAAIAEQFAPRVRVLRQDNGGISAARNRALSLAAGDTIAFLDADDLWPNGSLRARAECLEADPGLGCSFGQVEEFISPELPEAVQRGLTCAEGAMPGRLLGALLIRRELFEQVGEFDPAYRVGEGMDWIARAGSAGVRMHALDSIVLRRRIHATNTGSRLRHQKADYIRVLKAAIDRRRAAP